jgi:hypothetical protein
VVEDPLHVWKLQLSELRSQPPAEQDGSPQRAEKIVRSKAAMNGVGKSEQVIVSQNRSNKPDRAEIALHWIGEEIGERRACVKRNSDEQTMSRTQSRKHDMSHALERVRQRGNRTGKDIPGLTHASLHATTQDKSPVLQKGRFKVLENRSRFVLLVSSSST